MPAASLNHACTHGCDAAGGQRDVILATLIARLRSRTSREDAMKLTSEQIKTFDEQGYLFFPNCFSEEEVAVLRSEADDIFRTNRQEVWREKTGAPRTNRKSTRLNSS